MKRPTDASVLPRTGSFREISLLRSLTPDPIDPARAHLGSGS
jgi:hypothetical protein